MRGLLEEVPIQQVPSDIARLNDGQAIYVRNSHRSNLVSGSVVRADNCALSNRRRARLVFHLH